MIYVRSVVIHVDPVPYISLLLYPHQLNDPRIKQGGGNWIDRDPGGGQNSSRNHLGSGLLADPNRMGSVQVVSSTNGDLVIDDHTGQSNTPITPGDADAVSETKWVIFDDEMSHHVLTHDYNWFSLCSLIFFRCCCFYKKKKKNKPVRQR